MVPSAGTLGAVVESALKDMIAEANVQAAQAKITLFIDAAVLAIALLVAIGGFLLVRNRVSRPLFALTAVMRRMAQQDLDVVVPGTARGDELGAMAMTVSIFRQNGLTMRRLEAEAAEQRQSAEAEQQRAAAEQTHLAAQQAAVVEALGFGLERLSQGELTCAITGEFAPEYDRLRADFNKAVSGLQSLVQDIVSHTTTIRSGTQEIASASDDLSRRTEQQAAGLAQTAAALQEITATVRRTAEGSQEARSLASATREDAEQSGSVVHNAVAAMAAIDGSARQISQIIGVIDEIAFQTNLLALNAGVEAARAGESGRGFAVVASEVRALAQRSAEAAKQIKGLIHTSGQQVGRGVTLVGEAGDALSRILSKVVTIGRVIDEIAASTGEQARGLQEVNKAVAEMDHVTQQNAAMVEQTTASTHSLSQEIDELARATSRFRTSQREAHKANSSPYPPTRMARAV
jgi:methyl-accepting chemotaxis protein